MKIQELRAGYASGTIQPTAIVREIIAGISETGALPVWISVRSEEDILSDLAKADPALPLYGIPFAVKDNIDVAGLPTTAACPAFSYNPGTSAEVVERLRAAGALLIGKTNMDQFATGLVGTRSPFGACSSVYGKEFISGGSSSGSAVAVASGLVAFSLGTDTAGSGRVPAAFNNLVGVKPTRGLISTRGVVPACASLDCVSIFANDVDDAMTVLDVAAGPSAADPWSRAFTPPPARTGPFRLGVPPRDQLEFFGDSEAARLFEERVERFRAGGAVLVETGISDFLEAARLLYGGGWLAERDHAFGDFLRSHRDAVDPVVREVVLGAERLSARDVFEGFYKLQALRAKTEAVWGEIDALLVPTTPTIYRHDEIARDPILLNSRLGTFTNFVNLLDLCALAVPAGFRSDGVPLGVTLVAPAHHDRILVEFAAGRFRRQGLARVAVVGAHLSGQPLNGQLTERGARLIESTTTSPSYRLYALETMPPKPGLVRVGSGGASIEVEVWEMPFEHFGSFVALIPPPLGIGSVELADGSWVKGFLCESLALETAPDITPFGGWRAYLNR